jgi:hypothetical protein
MLNTVLSFYLKVLWLTKPYNRLVIMIHIIILRNSKLFWMYTNCSLNLTTGCYLACSQESLHFADLLNCFEIWGAIQSVVSWYEGMSSAGTGLETENAPTPTQFPYLSISLRLCMHTLGKITRIRTFITFCKGQFTYNGEVITSPFLQGTKRIIKILIIRYGTKYISIHTSYEALTRRCQ